MQKRGGVSCCGKILVSMQEEVTVSHCRREMQIGVLMSTSTSAAIWKLKI